MTDCEKCKYYHNNCDAKFRCRIDIEKIQSDMVTEVLEKVYKHFEQHNKVVFDKYGILDEIAQIIDEYYMYFELRKQLKENKNE